MKRYVQCSSNKLTGWLQSPDVDDLVSEMDAREKRLVGKIANAGVLESYVLGIVDSIDLLRSEISPAFDTFLSMLVERM